MKTDNALVGINFSKLDTPVINYVDFLSTKIPLKTVNNLFVFTARNSFSALQKEGSKKDAREMLDSIKQKMRKVITPRYKNIKKVNNYAEAGLFTQNFYHHFSRKETDLIVMGKETGSHGTMNKFIVRHLPSQTLIVPEKSKHKLSNIVIALDQTELSAKILKKALDFCSLIPGTPTITCLHIGHMPGHTELAQIFGDSHQINAKEFRNIYNRYTKDLKESFENFIKEYTPGYNGQKLNIEFIGETRKPHHGLLKYLHSGKADFLIMGSISQSLFDAMLLGSFAEKIIAKNDIVPMLIVK